MFRPRVCFRQKLVQFILKTTLCGSWALGIFPFTYDAGIRKLRRSKWLIAYGLALNAGLVFVMVSSLKEEESPLLIETFQRNPLAKQIRNLTDIFTLFTVGLVHFKNFWLSGELCAIHNELLDLQYRHLAEYYSDDCYKFDFLVICKGLSIILEFVCMLLLEYILSPNYSQQYVIGALTLCVVQFGVLSVAMHFHLAVVYMYRYMWIINRELLKSVDHLKAGKTVDSASIDLLLSMYTRLVELSERLVGIYDFQITLLMITFLATNILGVFFIIVYCISLKRVFTLAMWICIPPTFAINLLDFWLSLTVFEMSENEGNGTLRIIKLFNGIETIEKGLERDLSVFALFCSHRRLRFRHCGIFYVNYAMGYRMIITSFMYLLFLVQFDFHNL